MVNCPCWLCNFRVVACAQENFLTVGAGDEVAAWCLCRACKVLFFPDGCTILYFRWVIAFSVWCWPLSFGWSNGGRCDAVGAGVWPLLGVPVGFGASFIIFVGRFGLMFLCVIVGLGFNTGGWVGRVGVGVWPFVVVLFGAERGCLISAGWLDLECRWVVITSGRDPPPAFG